MGIYKHLSLGRKEKSFNATLIIRCRDMILHNYMEYLDTNDTRYFTKEFVYAHGIVDAMAKFYGNMLELTSDHRIIGRFSKYHKIMKLKGKYDSVSLLLQAMYDFDSKHGEERLEEIIGYLNEWGYSINKKSDLIEQANSINSKLQGLLTQIELIEREIKSGDAEAKIEIAEQIIDVGRILELGYRIDPKVTDVHEWILLQKKAKEKNERNRPDSIKKGTR